MNENKYFHLLKVYEKENSTIFNDDFEEILLNYNNIVKDEEDYFKSLKKNESRRICI